MKQAFKISSLYFVIALTWILVSDYWFMSSDILFLGMFDVQSIKGFFFIVITSMLLFGMVLQLVQKHQHELIKRKRREAELLALSEENQRFRYLFEQVSSGMVITDPKSDGNPIIFANKGFETITGFSAKEVVGKSARFLKKDNINPEISEKVNIAITEQKAIQIDVPSYRKDGRFFWNELKISPIFDQEGELRYYTGIQDDVTERKEQGYLLENQFKIVEQILLATEEESSLEKTCQIIEKHFRAGCTILQFNQADNQLHLFTSAKIPAIFAEVIESHTRVELNEKYNLELFTEQTLLIDNVSQFEHLKGLRKVVDRYGYKSIWTTPLRSKTNQILGIFAIYYTEDYRQMSGNIQAFENYASLLTIALQKEDYLDQIVRSDRQYRLISENSTDMVCLLDEQLIVEYFSPSHERLLGINYSFDLLKSCLSILSLERLQLFINLLLDNGQEDYIELEVENTNGKSRWIEMNGRRFLDKQEQKQKLLLSSREITDRKKFEDALNRSLYYDMLTQLPNRYYFKKILEKQVSPSKSYALVVLDFYQMKDIINLYGNDAGDYIYREFANKVRSNLAVETIARTSEDEFSLLLSDLTSYQQLEDQIKVLLNTIEQPWNYQDVSFVTTISVGVSIYEEQSAEQLILQAELALREAKTKGKQHYHIYLDQTDQGGKASIALQNDLYHALELEQLRVYYQPIINIDSQQVEGVEALARWQHPNFGLVSPIDFIPIAEETGWIVTISAWILKRVCLDLVEWNNAGIKRHASINISYRQMEEQDFVDKVKGIIKETGCPADQITFEITEGILMEDLAMSLRVLQQLKDFGIRISVDDFGIGYSSLSYLKKFPIDILKIDRTFVMGIDEDSNDHAIVQAIMEMSKALDLEVIAEGVETIKHVHLLRKLGCEHFQGYWYSKPVPKDQLTKIIETIELEKLNVATS
jgi:PAS domain S-box-containing protein/diguanylate cyclase (GGDEF)-like protein